MSSALRIFIGSILVCMLLQSSISFSATSSAKIEEMLEVVQKNFEAGELKRSVDILREILNIDQRHAGAHAKLGVILVRMGQFHEGVVHLKRAISFAPEDVGYRVSLAQSYEFKGMYDEAIEVYREVSQMTPASSPPHEEATKKITFLTATKLAREGEVEKARSIFSELAEKYPDDFLIRYSLGLAYFFLKQMDLALVEFKQVVALNPKYVSAYLNIATIYENRRDMDKAIESLQTAADLDPAGRIGVRAKERLGLIEADLLASSGSHQDALDVLEVVVITNPKNVPALMMMARSYAQLGRYDSAIESYKKVIAIVPKHLEARFQLAGLYLRERRNGEAIDLLERLVVEAEGTRYAEEANKILGTISGKTIFQSMSEEEKQGVVEEFLLENIKQNPQDEESHLRLAQFYVSSKMIEKAYQVVLSAAEVLPRSLKIANIKAAIATDLRRYEVAIDAYSSVVALSADEEKAQQAANNIRMAVVRLSFQEGRLGMAESELNDIIAENPDNVIAYHMLGLIYAREEEFLKAIDAYENAIRLNPANFGARLNLAGVLERLNREEDAISEYRKIVQEKPSEEVLDNAKARLFATEKRIKGLAVSMGYSMAYDNRVYENIDAESSEHRSDLVFNFSYQYKMKSGIRWRFSSTPTYTTYHKGQFDFLNSSNTLAATLTPGKYTLVGGYTNRRAQGLLNELRSSSSDVYFTEATTRKRIFKLFKPFSGETEMAGITLSLSRANFVSESSRVFNSLSYRLSGTVEQRLTDISSVRLGYNYVRNNNTHEDGSDYAYHSHQATMRLERRFEGGYTGDVSYGYTLSNYLNRDSFTLFKRFRKNQAHNISAGIAYWLGRKARLSARYTRTKVSSNLGVKQTLTFAEFEEGQRIQSNSLGGSESENFTVGFHFFF